LQENLELEEVKSGSGKGGKDDLDPHDEKKMAVILTFNP
jgi:hypothetical protein